MATETEVAHQLLADKKELTDQMQFLVQMYYDGAWDFTHSRAKFHDMMEEYVHFLEIECAVKIDKKEIA